MEWSQVTTNLQKEMIEKKDIMMKGSTIHPNLMVQFLGTGQKWWLERKEEDHWDINYQIEENLLRYGMDMESNVDSE